MKRLILTGLLVLIVGCLPAKAEDVTVPDGIDADVLLFYLSGSSVGLVLNFAPTYTMPEEMPEITLEYGEKRVDENKIVLDVENDMTDDERFTTVVVILDNLKPGKTYRYAITLRFKNVEYVYDYAFNLPPAL